MCLTVSVTAQGCERRGAGSGKQSCEHGRGLARPQQECAGAGSGGGRPAVHAPRGMNAALPWRRPAVCQASRFYEFQGGPNVRSRPQLGLTCAERPPIAHRGDCASAAGGRSLSARCSGRAARLGAAGARRHGGGGAQRQLQSADPRERRGARARGAACAQSLSETPSCPPRRREQGGARAAVRSCMQRSSACRVGGGGAASATGSVAARGEARGGQTRASAMDWGRTTRLPAVTEARGARTRAGGAWYGPRRRSRQARAPASLQAITPRGRPCSKKHFIFLNGSIFFNFPPSLQLLEMDG